MTGFSDCSFLCSLHDFLPTAKKYTLPTPKVWCGTRPADIGGRIVAAVQWLLEVEKARWVYQQCSKKEKMDKGNPRVTWNKEHWSIWKAQLEFYGDDERVETAAREAAKKALQQMRAVET